MNTANLNLWVPSGAYWAWPHTRGGGAAVTALRCYFHWLWIPTKQRYSHIGINVTSGAALSLAQIGLYNAINGVPFLPLFRSASVSTASNGDVEVALTGPSGAGMYLDAGYYFAAFCCDGTPNIRNHLSSGPGGIGYATLATTTINTFMHATLGSLSLPDRADGLTYTQASGSFPGVMLKAA